MSAAVPDVDREGSGAPTPVLRTLVMCDLVDSTGIVARLGDRAAFELFQKLDQLGRAVCARHGGREVDKTDGFLLLFERPAQALQFALDYQRELKSLSGRESEPLRARIGIHVGDVLLWQNSSEAVSHGAKRVEVEGLVKPLAARLMTLALPGQTLMSGMTYALAQRAEGELKRAHAGLRVKFHGRYALKGIPQPIPVYEIGTEDTAPFLRPPSGDKAKRYVPWWRSPKVIVAELFAALAVIAVIAFVSTRPTPAIAFAERDWVVVGDLRNLTGDALLDDSLRAAFRISLEQSRFVNVVSDLSARAALQRMRRDPDTPVDRAVGAEIALREGARALILPTVAMAGGRIRVSAEVIDPKNDTTVYAESADGVGTESALPSIDRVTQDLRQSLGEALAAIESDTKPLAKVTTQNIEALREYSLGLDAISQSRFADALAHYAKAVELDPGFALAHVGLARVRLSGDDRAAALVHLRAAEALRDDLPAREALHLDALLAGYDTPARMLEKWKLLGSMYPSAFGAFANYGLFAWQYTNEIDAAIDVTKHALSDHSPQLRNTHFLLGTLYLAADRIDLAEQHMRTSQDLGGGGLALHHADVHAARRDYAAARARLAAGHASGVATNDVFAARNAITLELDPGRFDAAYAAARAAVESARAAGPLYGRVFLLTELTLASHALDETAFHARLAAALDDEIALLGRDDDADPPFTVFAITAYAYLAARTGAPELAQRALAAAGERARGYRAMDDMRVLAQAQIRLADGAAREALDLVRARVDGAELYLVHRTLLDALEATDDLRAARAEAHWLARHRGRAYGEFNGLQAAQALNVLESNLAHLRAAELAHALGDDDGMRSDLAAFDAAWPQARDVAFVKERLDRLAAR